MKANKTALARARARYRTTTIIENEELPLAHKVYALADALVGGHKQEAAALVRICVDRRQAALEGDLIRRDYGFLLLCATRNQE